jgi:hypothetical protein
VYGGGGGGATTVATFLYDFVELFNKSLTDCSIANWSVQYGAATNVNWSVLTPHVLASSSPVTIPAGHYYLLEESASSTGQALPTPDDIGTLNLAATAGKLALLSTSTSLGGVSSTAVLTHPNLIDFVGFGATANTYEGSGPTPAPSTTASVQRNGNGCTDTDNNVADLAVSVGVPVARNSATAANLCP